MSAGRAATLTGLVFGCVVGVPFCAGWLTDRVLADRREARRLAWLQHYDALRQQRAER